MHTRPKLKVLGPSLKWQPSGKTIKIMYCSLGNKTLDDVKKNRCRDYSLWWSDPYYNNTYTSP